MIAITIEAIRQATITARESVQIAGTKLMVGEGPSRPNGHLCFH
jgi:hypothetical protein